MDTVSWHLPRGIVSAILSGMMAALESSGGRGFGKRRFKTRGGIDLGLKGRSLIPQTPEHPPWAVPLYLECWRKVRT